MMSLVSTNILVLASHSEATIEQWCNKAMYLAAKQLKASGRPPRFLPPIGPAEGEFNDFRNWRRAAARALHHRHVAGGYQDGPVIKALRATSRRVTTMVSGQHRVLLRRR
jgi:hypothetical protein